MYISTARALAEAASAAGHEELALRYLLRLVGHDPYDEHAHLALVSSFERIGVAVRRAARTDEFARMVARGGPGRLSGGT